MKTTEERLESATALLTEAATHMADQETSPSKDWWKRYFLHDGAHMVLTEEGWEPGESVYWTEAENLKEGWDIREGILDEVNRPDKPEQCDCFACDGTGMVHLETGGEPVDCPCCSEAAYDPTNRELCQPRSQDNAPGSHA